MKELDNGKLLKGSKILLLCPPKKLGIRVGKKRPKWVPAGITRDGDKFDLHGNKAKSSFIIVNIVFK